MSSPCPAGITSRFWRRSDGRRLSESEAHTMAKKQKGKATDMASHRRAKARVQAIQSLMERVTSVAGMATKRVTVGAMSAHPGNTSDSSKYQKGQAQQGPGSQTQARWDLRTRLDRRSNPKLRRGPRESGAYGASQTSGRFVASRWSRESVKSTCARNLAL